MIKNAKYRIPLLRISAAAFKFLFILKCAFIINKKNNENYLYWLDLNCNALNLRLTYSIQIKLNDKTQYCGTSR